MKILNILNFKASENLPIFPTIPKYNNIITMMIIILCTRYNVIENGLSVVYNIIYRNSDANNIQIDI